MLKKMIIGVLIIFLTLSISGIVSATTIEVNPGDSIQQAINSLPSTGGTIILKDGIHEVSNNIVIDKSNIILRGSGMNETIITSDSGMTYLHVSKINDIGNQHDYFYQNFITPTVEKYSNEYLSNITIEELTIKGKDIGRENNGIIYFMVKESQISNVKVIDNYNHGIGSYYNYDITINDCIIDNNGRNLFLWLITDSEIIDNSITNSHRWNGLQFNHWCSKNLVKGNYFSGNMVESALYIYTSNNIIVEENTFEENVGGILLYSSRDNIIKNNIVVKNTKNGIYSWDQSPHPEYINYVYSNVVYSNEKSGILNGEGVIQLVAKNNIVTNNGDYGISGRIDSSYNNAWNNYNGNYNGVLQGEGDISENPKFIDEINNDFHLQLNSPCINTGSNGIDMGIYDYEEDPLEYCGDDICNTDETSITCPIDCEQEIETETELNSNTIIFLALVMFILIIVIRRR